MNSIWEEIGINIEHVAQTNVSGRFEVICDKAWLQTLEQQRKLSSFTHWPALDRRAHPTGTLAHPWTRVVVQTYRKEPQRRVQPLAKPSIDQAEPTTPLTYSQSIAYVASANFKQRWQHAHKRYANAAVVNVTRTGTSALKPAPAWQQHDLALCELIRRTYKCTIISCKHGCASSDEELQHESAVAANIMPAIAAIESTTHFSVFFYPPALQFNLYDCLTYSPAVLGKSYNKTLFIIYQLLQLSKSLQTCGLFLGDLRLQHILLRDNLWLQVVPQLTCNLTPYDNEPESEPETAALKLDLKIAYDLTQFTLREYTELWCNNQLSNFDYLTVLNNATGRSMRDAAHHHIMPWVTDFTARNGNWRDLNKSKYRLNKGDTHLDLMYMSASTAAVSSTQAPHHVSDFLSEITYFVYMARRTPKQLLCAHVRPIWVPAEYPVSIQRLQEWTPDECIPEFYTDPQVFKSIHEDLPDLELPPWASCPEDFICKHREALESQYVSERLHHWIDLNFGYKLNGKAAIKSKNVCLSLVDQHKYLCQRGIVQLFTQPHPPKRFPSPWFGKVAPRLDSLYKGTLARSLNQLQKLRPLDQSRRFVRSIDNLHVTDDIESPTTTANFYPSLNFIELPKDYNPIALLQNYEYMHGFFARTFPKQHASTTDPQEKLYKSDLLFDDNSESHSFTNHLYEAMPTDASSANSRNLLAPDASKSTVSSKQLLAEKREREQQVLGCLIVELFAMSRLRPLLMGNGFEASFEARLNACRTVLSLHPQDVPKCVRKTAYVLLKLQTAEKFGLPHLTITQLLEPIFMNSLIPFPNHYYAVYALARTLHDFDMNSALLQLHAHFNCDGSDCGKYTGIDMQRVAIERKLAECKVMTCCAHIRRLLEPQAFEQYAPVDLLLPHILELLNDEHTSILTSWHLFDTVAQALGIKRTQELLLLPIMKLYDDVDMTSVRSRYMDDASSAPDQLRFSISSSFKSRKSVKLYHHSFLLRLIVRFGLRCFLQHFITPLIEAVGGYKEPEAGNGLHYHSTATSTASRHAKLQDSAVVTEKIKAESSPKVEAGAGFQYDDDELNLDRLSLENKSIDSFELPGTTLTAEEATEYEDNLALSANIMFSSNTPDDADGDSSNKSINTQDTPPESMSLASMGGPRSPTIDIPGGGLRRNYQLNGISCEVGSRKSVDSFDVLAQATDDDAESKAQAKLPAAKSEPNNRISIMSAESLVWLSHRLGPVLTTRYITRNLLKMLSLCYVGQENLMPMNDEQHEHELSSDNLNYFSVAEARVVGDHSAARVLECLMSITAIFGEELIIYHYFPHIAEIVCSCGKRLTGNLEGAIISALQLFKFMLPCLRDVTLMAQLKELMLERLMLPILRILSSTSAPMPSGYLGRSVLARKYLDAMYTLCVRLGAEMSREHLAQTLLGPYFQIFNKAYTTQSASSEAQNEIDQLTARACEELQDVFSPALAYTAYLPLLRFMGESNMQRSVTNFEYIVMLCHEHMQPQPEASRAASPVDNVDSPKEPERPVTPANSFGPQIIGNRIEPAVRDATGDTDDEDDIGHTHVVNMVAYKFDRLSTTRHLKGNWLAYWQHEITRPTKASVLNIKQMRLQKFTGHTNCVRALLALDNENSFISASKDKTVKLWSLRSESDETKSSTCQYTYTLHRRAVHSLSFLESLRYVVSCDSNVHIWDPFMGKPLGVFGTPKQMTVVKGLPTPAPLIAGGTTDAQVKLIDARCMEYVSKWRVLPAPAPNAIVRCLAAAPSGNWLAAGLSTGNIVTLDTRTGMILNSWRPVETDILQLAAPNDQQIVSSAVNHSLAVWKAQDGILHYELRAPPEPPHYLQTIESELVFATSSGHVGVYADLSNSHATHSVTKLRSECFRGLLSSLAVLPLNRAILAGNESGHISLLC